MTGPERGFLLLTAALGDPEAKPLTRAQFRELTLRMRDASPSCEDRDVVPEDLIRLGYGREMAERIVSLLSREDLLDRKLESCRRAGCGCLTRISRDYPQALREKLGPEAPGVLFYKGDLSILTQPSVALVGSRDLSPENESFAREAGRQAALQGYVLVSGNARGADRTAQDACLAAGGKVISVVADDLSGQSPSKNILWLSEDGFDLDFTPQRALSRNRIIHALPRLTLVAQCSLRTGGTWNGTMQNLRHSWSPVAIFSDGSGAAAALCQSGGEPVGEASLSDLDALIPAEIKLF